MKVLPFCHNPRASSLPPGFIVFFLTCYVHKMESAQFTVVGPHEPVTAVLGQEAVLPCHLSPQMSAANMEVKWFRYDAVSIVHLYHDGADQYEKQMREYRGRTELLKAGLTDGNIPLRIFNIILSDEGQYHCFVQDDTFYEAVVLELQVAGLGSGPDISVEGHQDRKIQLVCRSSGWYPQPEAQWRDLQGKPLSSASEKISQDVNGLFHTEIAIVLTAESNQKVSCHVMNPRLNQGREATISIAGQLFPQDSSLVVGLAVGLGISLTLLTPVIVLIIYGVCTIIRDR